MSGAWSATIFFRRLFSASSSFSHLASVAFVPPQVFIERHQVASVTPKERATSAALEPLSSRSLPTAGLSVRLLEGAGKGLHGAVVLCFQSGSPDSHLGWTDFGGARRSL